MMKPVTRRTASPRLNALDTTPKTHNVHAYSKINSWKSTNRTLLPAPRCTFSCKSNAIVAPITSAAVDVLHVRSQKLNFSVPTVSDAL
jgi:hypothetical protein